MIKTVRPIFTAEGLKNDLPVPPATIEARRRAIAEIADIISGKDKRKLIVIGPCSADNEKAVCKYAQKLAAVAEKIKDRCYTVLRVYTQKPRSRGEGYMGLLHNPDPNDSVTDIVGGLRASRALHIKAASESGLFTADEMMYPDTYDYFDDILVYATVGARSSEDPLHRFVASGANIPVGIKNPTNGSMSSMLDGVHAATVGNEFLYRGSQVRSDGNRLAHAVLRGYTDSDGNHICNCDTESLSELYDLCERRQQPCSVIVDIGHSNSGKNPYEQIRIAKNTLNALATETRLNDMVKGFMAESYLEDGNAAADGAKYGRSFTDGCLGWDKTERLLYDIADHIVV